MKILIVGLGLMGGAYAMRLSAQGYEVYGVDKNNDSIEYAVINGYLVAGSTNPIDYLKDMDVLILAIYPQSILDFLKEYHKEFNENLLITDICGVKSSFVLEATQIAKPAIYCSHHPMAGREKIGITYAKECDFTNANFLITPTYLVPDQAINTLKELGKAMRFGNITVMDIHYHDKMIGFTSQLAHAIAVSLVNCDHDPNTKNFIGDSYRDLTRIAMINETLWSELFLENKENLLAHIKSFEEELDKLKLALENSDKEGLKALFTSAKTIRKKMEK